MNLKRAVFVLQHSATTYLLAFLLARQSGMDLHGALLMAGVITVRDVKSLFDNIFDVGLVQEHKDEEVKNDQEDRKVD